LQVIAADLIHAGVTVQAFNQREIWREV